MGLGLSLQGEVYCMAAWLIQKAQGPEYQGYYT